ncbi:hypothetical protein SAMN06295987_1208 [Novosphingobium mathurense]|uniref:Uncharacterized protein n=1 Tax=Novosphingobium mathurense TaxID=428990 RepID=A0A1U6IX10_9SPHN|nr:hypothetical protein SAMN06295987_1208 [Novosphingobium mathurense]
MSLDQAQAFAFSLSRSLMTVIVIFCAGDGTHAVAPSNEFEGDADIVAEIDPFDF